MLGTIATTDPSRPPSSACASSCRAKDECQCYGVFALGRGEHLLESLGRETMRRELSVVLGFEAPLAVLERRPSDDASEERTLRIDAPVRKRGLFRRFDSASTVPLAARISPRGYWTVRVCCED